MPRWLKAIFKVIPWRWVFSRFLKRLDKRAVPDLKIRASKLGQWFSRKLRELAAKGQLSAKNAEEVESLCEEIDKAFWKGANIDD